MNVKLLLKHLITSPKSPEGRKMRIERLMHKTEEERDICAGIVYVRDMRLLTDEETQDFNRIIERLHSGEITLPVDR